MKIYLLTQKNSAFLETFKSFEEIKKRTEELNNTIFDGEPFMFFGKDGDKPYVIDSICLTKKVNYKEIYTTFFIRCINSNTGEICEL